MSIPFNFKSDNNINEVTEHNIEIERKGSRKKMSYTNAKWIEENEKYFPRLDAVKSCACRLYYNYYHLIKKFESKKLIACHEPFICPFCAASRAAKGVRNLKERVEKILKDDSGLKLFYLVLTIKNGRDLRERFLHLQKSIRVLKQHRRESIAFLKGKRPRGKVNSALVNIAGAAYSYELTFRSSGWTTLRNKPSEYWKQRRKCRIKDGKHQILYIKEDEGWHPHINFLILAEEEIDVSDLRKEWFSITDDSYILRIDEKESNIKTFLEIMKYCLKFSSMDSEKCYEAWEFFKGTSGKRYRLTGTLGNLYGLKLENKKEEVKMDDQPYYELIYQWMKDSGYELKNFKYIT